MKHFGAKVNRKISAVYIANENDFSDMGSLFRTIEFVPTPDGDTNNAL